MDIVCLCPLRARSLLWQPAPERWARTVVVKATYRLQPGTSPLAEEQEDVRAAEAHWDDDPRRSLYAPSDLVPFKLRAEVVLVGSAYAPNGAAVPSLVARLRVRDIDKGIEVLGARVRTLDGDIREGARWTTVPLTYERAAGGPDTANPVGIAADAPPDIYGQRQLPGLQPPGFHATPDGASIPTIGFGPIAAGWYSRTAKLGRGYREKDWNAAPFAEGFDGAYFQAAPPDQQTDSLGPDERLVLEHLHPEHARLVTQLPNVEPRVLLEPRGGASREVPMSADTLWIDTGRGICTLAFRGRVDLERPDDTGRFVVVMGKSGTRPDWSSILGGIPAPAAEPRPPVRPTLESRPSFDTRPMRGAPIDPADSGPRRPMTLQVSASMLGEKPHLPFQRAQPGPPVTASVPSMAAAVAAVAPAAPAHRERQPTVEVEAPNPATLPAWLTREPAPAPARPVVPAGELEEVEAESADDIHLPPTLPPPPPVGEILRARETPPTFEKPALFTPPSPVAPVTPKAPAASASPPRPPAPVTPLRSFEPAGGSSGLLAISNAAAGVTDVAGAGAAGKAPAAAPEAKPAAPSDAAIELLWFDPPLVPLLRKHPVFSPLLRPPPDVLPAGRQSPGPSAEDVTRGQVFDVLLKGVPRNGMDLDSADPGEPEGPTVPLVLLRGDMELPFDEIDVLRAVAAASRSLAAADKKLKEVLDMADEMLKAPVRGSGEIAAGLTARLRDAWSKANRSLPASYIDTTTERMLLEQRAYQKRDVLDGTWIRALLTGEGFESPLPTYLPPKIEKRIPMFRRFPARLLGHVHPAQDQYESSPVCVQVVALGRVVPARGARRRDPR